MMTWLTKNLGWMIALLGMMLGGAIGYGRISQIVDQVDTKASQAVVNRELDQIQLKLQCIDGKLDQLLFQRASQPK
jgi:hypothetical protein